MPTDLLIPVHVIPCRLIWVVSRIFAIIYANNMGSRVVTSFYLCNNISAWDVLTPANVVVLVTATRTIIFSLNTCQFCSPCMDRVMIRLVSI